MNAVKEFLQQYTSSGRRKARLREMLRQDAAASDHKRVVFREKPVNKLGFFSTDRPRTLVAIGVVITLFMWSPVLLGMWDAWWRADRRDREMAEFRKQLDREEAALDKLLTKS